MNSIEKVRLDKWLWSVRLFKTRTLAGNMCKGGDVKLQGRKLKPSFQVSVGDALQIRKNGFNLQIEVVKLIERRVSATLAAECYVNRTPEEEMRKFEDWFIGKAAPERRERGTGRPTKKERRDIDQFKEDWFS